MSQSMVGWITYLHRFGQHLFWQQFLVQVACQQRDEDGRQRQQSSLLRCLLQFVVNQLERFVEYVNQWAFGTYFVFVVGDCQ
jgi:hypothetical protein